MTEKRALSAHIIASNPTKAGLDEATKMLWTTRQHANAGESVTQEVADPANLSSKSHNECLRKAVGNNDVTQTFGEKIISFLAPLVFLCAIFYAPQPIAFRFSYMTQVISISFIYASIFFMFYFHNNKRIRAKTHNQ